MARRQGGGRAGSPRQHRTRWGRAARPAAGARRRQPTRVVVYGGLRAALLAALMALLRG
jgi:hypothetical protein